jgi:hypothetical protein
MMLENALMFSQEEELRAGLKTHRIPKSPPIDF